MNQVERLEEKIAQHEEEMALRRATLQFVGSDNWTLFCQALQPQIKKHAHALQTKELSLYELGLRQGFHRGLSILSSAREDIEQRIAQLAIELEVLRKSLKRLRDRDLLYAGGEEQPDQ